MARSIEYWYNECVGEKNRQPGLAGITSTSKLSIFGLLAWVFSFVAWLLDNLFDLHKGECGTLIAAEKAHRPEWYKSLALAFQHGQAFNVVTQKFDNTGLTEAEIEAQKIVAQASVTEVDGRLRMKVARMVDGDFAPLDEEQLAAFAAYMEKAKDFGVNIKKESLPADSLKLDLDIFYNPLVLRADGSRIDGNGSTPVIDAVRQYLRELRFDGEYANSRLNDKLQGVEGVELPVIKSALSKYGSRPYSLIDERYIPDAGYLRLATSDITINYRPYV
jgi:hypothetical protein